MLSDYISHKGYVMQMVGWLVGLPSKLHFAVLLS
jgi:hypothetical protein